MCNFKLAGFEPTAFISLGKFGLPVELFYTPQPFFYFKRDTAFGLDTVDTIGFFLRISI